MRTAHPTRPAPKTPTGEVLLRVGEVLQAGYSFCSFADPLRAILYWVVAVFSAVAIWNTVYGERA